MSTSSIQFCEMARYLKMLCSARGLHSPSFRSPPRSEGNRSIRRYTDGTTLVSVRTTDRSSSDVLADMVEGVVVANSLPPAAARALHLAAIPHPGSAAA